VKTPKPRILIAASMLAVFPALASCVPAATAAKAAAPAAPQKVAVAPAVKAPVLTFSALTVTRSAVIGQPVLASFTVSGRGTLRDLAVAVRDSSKVDDGHLDFPHVGAIVINGSRTFSTRVVEPAKGEYWVSMAYNFNGKWVHVTSPATTFQVTAAPVSTPTATPTTAAPTAAPTTAAPTAAPTTAAPTAAPTTAAPTAAPTTAAPTAAPTTAAPTAAPTTAAPTAAPTTAAPTAAPTTAAPTQAPSTVSVTGLTVTPSAQLGQPATATFSVSGNANLDDLAASVRDASNVDDGHLDFPHVGAVTISGARTFSEQVVESSTGTYTVGIAYNSNGTWVHVSNPTTSFKVIPVPAPTATATPTASPTATPTTTPTTPVVTTNNPIGSTGARSGLSWNSGIWPLDRSAQGDVSNYAATLAYAEGRRGRKADINMWAQWNNSWSDLTNLQVLKWLNETPDATSVVMLPPFPDGGSWTAAANGDYDSYYRQIGAQIVAIRPNAKTVLRFAWEANGNWYSWSIVNSGGASAFIAGWDRAVTDMRAGAGSKASNIVFDYSLSNLDDKGQGDPLTATYPGDKYVDVIGIDAYDQWQVTTSPTVPGKAAFLNRTYDFAKAHGKWMSIDEWGLHHTGDGSPEGGDNPNYISAMYTWIKAHKDILAWESYFQDDAMNNVNSSLFSPDVDHNPNSRTAYLAAQKS
jgi:hypothetical protein